jgi:CrcB protein
MKFEGFSVSAMANTGQQAKTAILPAGVKSAAMNATSLFAIGVGAVLGAWLRWGLGLWLNPLFPTVPLGTLAANLVGGYLIGAAVAVFHINVELSPELRLFFVTGFLGALTTFSTFSAEVVHLIQSARYAWALGAASLHLFGSLLMTGLGIFTIHKLAQ